MADSVITSTDIQNRYQKLYTYLMDFLWDFDVFEKIADLEISIYDTFPDKDNMLKCLKELQYEIKDTYEDLAENDDPGFEDAFKALQKSIDDYNPDNALVELYSVEQSVELPDDTDEEDTEVFRMGNIQHRHLDENDEVEENDEVIEEPDRLANPFEEE